MSYIDEIFHFTGVTPAELKADPSLVTMMVEVGMRITRGQANPHLLEAELKSYQLPADSSSS